MCGICGFVGDFDADLLPRMTAAISHRGPDDEGFFARRGVGLGHRRLSIIDVEGGHQPVCSEDEEVWVSYNGEIYNHLEIRRELVKRHDFRTRSDTEAIVHLYEEVGDSVVEHLRGMFAFAIWDERRRRLLLARDRFGVKPLYYVERPEGLVFASEIKALLAAGVLEPQLDPEAIPSFLDFRYVAGERTMFRGVKRLAPGSILTWEDGRKKLSKYWQLDYTKRPFQREEEVVEEFTAIASESVGIRLMSEVPIGAFLSGGLDSSFIVALMSRAAATSVSTFTASLEGQWHDEAPFASIVAKHLKTDHHPLPISADAGALLEEVVWYLDEPLADLTTIPTFMLSRLTRQFVTVALSGEGADELLGGYDKYSAHLIGSHIRRAVGGRLWGAGVGVPQSSVSRAFAYMAHRDDVAAYRTLTSVFSDAEKSRLLGPKLSGLAPDTSFVRDAFDRLDDPLDRMMELDIQTWLPNDVLLKADKMSMAHSLEVRVPFLDHQLAQFLASVPSRFKIKGRSEKYLLRKALRPLVPREITARKKHGFTVPLKRWLEGGLMSWVDRALSMERVQSLGLWDVSYVARLRRQDAANLYVRRQLLALVVFDIWHRVFIEGDSSLTRHSNT